MLKDEFERLKSKKITRSHVAKKITDARVDFVRRLIAKNCKQGMTNEVKPLQDILEAFVYISNKGVTLTQFPDLSFGPAALAFQRKLLLLVGGSRVAIIQRNDHLERLLYIQSDEMCSALLVQSDTVKELECCLREAGGMLTPKERSHKKTDEKRKAKRHDARDRFLPYIQAADIQLETLKEETLVTAPLLKQWKKINKDVWRDTSLSRSEAIDEIAIRLDTVLNSRKRKSKTDIEDLSVSSDDE